MNFQLIYDIVSPLVLSLPYVVPYLKSKITQKKVSAPVAITPGETAVKQQELATIPSSNSLSRKLVNPHPLVRKP